MCSVLKKLLLLWLPRTASMKRGLLLKKQCTRLRLVFELHWRREMARHLNKPSQALPPYWLHAKTLSKAAATARTRLGDSFAAAGHQPAALNLWGRSAVE